MIYYTVENLGDACCFIEYSLFEILIVWIVNIKSKFIDLFKISFFLWFYKKIQHKQFYFFGGIPNKENKFFLKKYERLDTLLFK